MNALATHVAKTQNVSIRFPDSDVLVMLDAVVIHQRDASAKDMMLVPMFAVVSMPFAN
jgi:hypothetical protein